MGNCIQLHLPNLNFLSVYSVNRSQEITLGQYVQKLSILCILFKTFSFPDPKYHLSTQKQQLKFGYGFSLKRKRNYISTEKKKKASHFCSCLAQFTWDSFSCCDSILIIKICPCYLKQKKMNEMEARVGTERGTWAWNLVKTRVANMNLETVG